jgi:hypothetical protein
MAYYNGFPATYQPMYQPPQYQAPVMQTPQYQAQQPQQQNTGGGITMVQIQGGEATAKSYLVAPNTTVQLWDIDEKTLYIKSADASGMPSMKVLDYTVRGEAEAPKAAPAPEYATKKEVRTLSDEILELREEIAGISKRRSRLLKEEEADE